MKKSILILILASLAATSFAQEQNYKQSQCYKDYVETYQKSVRSATNSMKFRRDLAFQTGIVLNSGPPSDYGKSEKSIVNAADLTPDYKESAIDSDFFLNDFSYIHHQVIQKFPETAPLTTREYIRKGFKTGAFCDKFLFIPYKKGRKGVANYVKDQMEEDLEKGALAKLSVNDSELDKTEFSSNGDSSGAQGAESGANVQSN